MKNIFLFERVNITCYSNVALTPFYFHGNERKSTYERLS